jgi:hypothetical protein
MTGKKSPHSAGLFAPDRAHVSNAVVALFTFAATRLGAAE